MPSPFRQLAVAAVLAAAVPLPASAQIFSTGGPVFVTFLGSSDTDLRSELWFFGAVNPGPDQTPFDSYSGTFLFANDDPQTSAAPGSGGVAALGSGAGDLNAGGMFAAGTELYFGLFVQDLYDAGQENPFAPGSRGAWFYTGGGADNYDGRIHAVVTPTSATEYRVGFEDLCRTSDQAPADPICYNTRARADFDFDDMVFLVSSSSTVPEPSTYVLLGTGLLAVGGMTVRRRRTTP